MALEALTARANTGTGTDQLAVVNTAQGKAGAVALVDAGGVLVDGANPVPVEVAALPLPSGAATEATLAALNAKIPAAGQALMAASQPVVIASNQTPIQTVEPALILTGAAAQTAVVNNILESVAGATWLDVSNYRSISVQVVSTGTGGTFIFEQSNDGVSAVALPVFNAGLATAVPIVAAITATASQIIYTFPVRCRFIRLRIATTITGGSIQTFARLSTEPWTPSVTSIAQATAANLQVTADTEMPAAAALSDAQSNPTAPTIGAAHMVFNGAAFERFRGNIVATVETSAARTASGNGTTQTNFNHRGVHLFVNVSAASGTTPTLAVQLQVQDPAGAGWVDVPGAVTPSITGIGVTMLSIYPGATPAANVAVSFPLPRVWRVRWTIGGTTPSFTFTVGAQLVL